MKQDIKSTVDPTTRKKSIEMKFTLDGFNAFLNNIHVVKKTYWDWWNERKRLHKYWDGYEDFLRADVPNRPILDEVIRLMESWFNQGVLYDEPTLLLGPGYYGEPETLQELLRIAQGKILANILEYMRFPEYLRPQILMWTSARGYGKGEAKASFEWKDYRLDDDVVYGTEGIIAAYRSVTTRFGSCQV